MANGAWGNWVLVIEDGVRAGSGPVVTSRGSWRGNSREEPVMSGPYQLAPEECPRPIAPPLPRLLDGIRNWLTNMETALAWYVDRWQR